MELADEPATGAQLTSLSRVRHGPIRPLANDRATHLIPFLEEHPQRDQASAENGVREIAKRQAYALRQAVEEAGRAVRDATRDGPEELQRILGAATGRRQAFWTDTCRDPPQMKNCSAQVLDLFMRYGCRFVVPSGEQVQDILNALDLFMPLWDLQQPEMFYQTLKLNFPQLDRLLL